MIKMRLLMEDHREWYKDPTWRKGDIVDVPDDEVSVLTIFGIAEKVVPEAQPEDSMYGQTYIARPDADDIGFTTEPFGADT